jgi:hypothetical protein
MQGLLGVAVWGADEVRDNVRAYVVDELGDPAGCSSWTIQHDSRLQHIEQMTFRQVIDACQVAALNPTDNTTRSSLAASYATGRPLVGPGFQR